MSRQAEIYIIRNVVNGKVYVGSTLKKERRFRDHREQLSRNKHICTHLQNAWNKYGADNFVFEIVEQCPEQDRREREQWWIGYTRSSDPRFGYNAQHTVRVLAPSVAMSEIHKQSWANDDQRKAEMGARMAADWQDPESRAKRMEWLDKVRHKSYQHWLTPEGRALRSEVSKRDWQNEETLPQKLEQLAGARDSWMQRRESDPQYAANHSELVKAGWTEDAKARRANSAVKEWQDIDPDKKRKKLAGIMATNAKRSEEARQKRIAIREWKLIEQELAYQYMPVMI